MRRMMFSVCLYVACHPSTYSLPKPSKERDIHPTYLMPAVIRRLQVLLGTTFCLVALLTIDASLAFVSWSSSSSSGPYETTWTVRRPGGNGRPDVAGILLSQYEQQEQPQENPSADMTRRSSAGVLFDSVLTGLHILFPPTTLEQRNAASRSDGYWPYIQNGQDPPLQLTYGEFDFTFFGQILETVPNIVNGRQQHGTTETSYCNTSAWKDKVFVDIGSGVGRLVFAAAALHPEWKECRGIEILPGLHEQAKVALQQCGKSRRLPTTNSITNDSTKHDSSSLQLAPISFVCGSFEDTDLGDADFIFVTASCLPSDLLGTLQDCVLKNCQPGTVIVTTDYALPIENQQQSTGGARLELLQSIEGWSWVTGGGSTAFVHQLQMPRKATSSGIYSYLDSLQSQS